MYNEYREYYLEYVGENVRNKSGESNKFYEIVQRDNEIAIRFGRIGTDGQTRVKNFPSDRDALHFIKSQITKKLQKGYVKIGEYIH